MCSILITTDGLSKGTVRTITSTLVSLLKTIRVQKQQASLRITLSMELLDTI